MNKQKKNRKKRGSFQTINLSHKQLMTRWILASLGLILLFVLLVILVVFIFSGKVKIPGIPQFAEPTNDPAQGTIAIQKEMSDYANLYHNYDYDELYQKQISKPKVGEEIAEIYIKGTDKPLKVKLFGDEAPEIVNQFKKLVKTGFYNNITLYTEENKIVQTLIADDRVCWEPLDEPEDPELEKQILENMESWETLEVKSHKVLPYNGALCAYDIVLNEKSYGANFFIMNMQPTSSQDLTDLNLSSQLISLFKKYGGDLRFVAARSYKNEYWNEDPHANLLDYMKHPTFGQVFEGMDFLEKLTKTDKNYEINKIEIVKYKE